MSLPEKGWAGYGKPGHPYEAKSAKQAYDDFHVALRLLAIKNDDEGHDLREIAFNNWCRDTVFPDAVDRLIAEIGRATK